MIGGGEGPAWGKGWEFGPPFAGLKNLGEERGGAVETKKRDCSPEGLHQRGIFEIKRASRDGKRAPFRDDMRTRKRERVEQVRKATVCFEHRKRGGRNSSWGKKGSRTAGVKKERDKKLVKAGCKVPLTEIN